VDHPGDRSRADLSELCFHHRPALAGDEMMTDGFALVELRWNAQLDLDVSEVDQRVIDPRDIAPPLPRLRVSQSNLQSAFTREQAERPARRSEAPRASASGGDPSRADSRTLDLHALRARSLSRCSQRRLLARDARGRRRVSASGADSRTLDLHALRARSLSR